MQQDGGHWIHADHTRGKIRKNKMECNNWPYPFIQISFSFIHKLKYSISVLANNSKAYTHKCTYILNVQYVHEYAYSRDRGNSQNACVYMHRCGCSCTSSKLTLLSYGKSYLMTCYFAIDGSNSVHGTNESVYSM